MNELNPKQVRINRNWAIVIGIGLALSPIHNQWLTDLVTKDGEVGFFIPAFGYFLWMFGASFSLLYTLRSWREIQWGNKNIFIPLLIIVGAMGLSGITASSWEDCVSPLGMGVMLFSLYLATRMLGKDVFLPLAIGSVVASLGCIIYGLFHPGLTSGGFVFERNYDIATGYILLGAALFVNRYQWLLAALALVAMFFSGSPEAIPVILIMMLVVLGRKDWGLRLAYILVPLLLAAIVYFGLGYGVKLYEYPMQIATGEHTVATELNSKEVTASAIEFRIIQIREAMTNLKPFGEGYNITSFNVGFVHNVPLVLVQQLGYPGIIAGLAWLWVSVYCLVRTKWKYVWAMILALSLFDHFMWTQLGLWWWVAVGVTTAFDIESDLIFKNPQKKTH